MDKKKNQERKPRYMTRHSKTCEMLTIAGKCDCGFVDPFDLQIKDFPLHIKNGVMSKAYSQGMTLKEITIRLYKEYNEGTNGGDLLKKALIEIAHISATHPKPKLAMEQVLAIAKETLDKITKGTN
jgi:hypothetical protein